MTKHDADKAPASHVDTENDETTTDQPAKDLTVKLSRSLYAKLLESAHDEGIAVDELAKEILAEGVTLRIWDILDRRMRTREGEMLHHQQNRGPQGGQNRGNQGNQGNQGNPGNNKGGHNRQHQGGPKGRNDRRQERYNNILNDGPSFLEYVRQLDKKR